MQKNNENKKRIENIGKRWDLTLYFLRSSSERLFQSAAIWHMMSVALVSVAFFATKVG